MTDLQRDLALMLRLSQSIKLFLSRKLNVPAGKTVALSMGIVDTEKKTFCVSYQIVEDHIEEPFSENY